MKTARSIWIILMDVALLLAAVLLFYPVVWRPDLISPGGDMLNLMLPARDWSQHWLARGVVPLWNPQVFGGVPFLGAMQAAVPYPPNLLLGAFLPPLTTINLLRFGHLFLFGLFMWLFLRAELRLVRPAAMLGALAVAGSAHVSSHTDHINQLAAIAWLPALVACQWRWWRTGSRWALAGFAVALAMQVLAGHPQAVFYSLLLSGGIALAWFIRGAERPERDEAGRSALLRFGRRRAGPLLMVGAAFGLGLALAAIQIMPTAETSGFSRRSVEAPDYPLWSSMPPRYVGALVTPRAYGDPTGGYTDRDFASEFGSFVGRTTLLFALLAVIAGVVERRWGVVFWFLAAVVAFALAFGGYGPFSEQTAEGLRPSPVYQLYLWLFPPARHLRVPPRILLLATFALAVLGAWGLDWLLRRSWWSQSSETRSLGSLFGWAVAVTLFVELWNFQRGEFHNVVVPYYPPRQLLAGQPREALAPVLGAPVDSAGLTPYRVFRLMVHDPDYLMDPRPTAVRNRCVRLQPNLGMMLNVSEVEGYEEGLLPPIRYFDFLNRFNRNLRNIDPDPVLLGLMNVRYLYLESNLTVKSNTWRPVGEVVEPATGRRYALFENPLWLPRVIWSRWVEDEIPLGALRGPLSRSGKPGERVTDRIQRYGPYRGAILERGWIVDPEERETLIVQSIEPNRIVVENPPGRGGELFMAQNAYPGWIAEAAGERVPFRPRTDFGAAATIPPGAEWIEIAYRPFSFRIGAYLSLVAALVWVASMVVIGRRRPGVGPPEEESMKEAPELS